MRRSALLLGVAVGLAAASPAAAAPALRARTAIVVESSTGDVAYALHPDRERLIASTTKLMTARIVLQRVALSDVFTAPGYSPSSPAESTIGLQKGERMTVRDLLRAVLLPSANDAAYTLAAGVAGSPGAFVRLMNRGARRLHLRHTHYANPIGLDDARNHSTARDLVTLARADRANRFFAHTVNLEKARLRSGRGHRTVVNRNTVLRRAPWVNGVKTGHTSAAGYVLVGSATRHGVTVVSAVLGDPSEAARDDDTLALLRYGLGRYRRAVVLRPRQVLARALLDGRDAERVDLVPARPYARVVRRGMRPVVSIAAPATVKGPLPAGATVGTATVRVAGHVVARVPIVTGAAVPEPSVASRVGHDLGRPGTLAGIAVVAAAGLLLLRRRRRRRAARTEVGTA